MPYLIVLVFVSGQVLTRKCQLFRQELMAVDARWNQPEEEHFPGIRLKREREWVDWQKEGF